jgi:hypothetical protein
VDDAAFLLLTKEDLIKASKLIVPHFRRFGLTVHTGFKSKGEGSKTEAMYIPKPQQESTTENTAAYDIDDDRFITFCDTFKYLGSTFTPDLVDTHDIETRIKQASKAFYAMNARVFRNTKIDIKLRMRTYEALIVNLVLWGCESWTIKACDKKKLEVFHNRCLRRILNLTMYQIKEHRIKNKEIRRRAANSYKMEQMMELRRCRWLKSISNMEDKRTPRKIIAAWTQQPPVERRPATDSQTWVRRNTRNIGLHWKCETRRVDDASKGRREMGSQSGMETRISSRELQTKKRARGSSLEEKYPEMDTTGFRPIKTF